MRDRNPTNAPPRRKHCSTPGAPATRRTGAIATPFAARGVVARVAMVCVLALSLAGSAAHAAITNGGFEQAPGPLGTTWWTTQATSWFGGGVCGDAPIAEDAQAHLDSTGAIDASGAEQVLRLAPGSILAANGVLGAQTHVLWQTIGANAGDVVRFEYDFLYSTLFANDFAFVTLSNGAGAQSVTLLPRGPLTTCGTPRVYRGGVNSFEVTIPEDGLFTLGFGVAKATRFASDVTLVVDRVELVPTAADLVLEGDATARVLPIGEGFVVSIDDGVGATLVGGPLADATGDGALALDVQDTAIVGLPVGSPDTIVVEEGTPVTIRSEVAGGEVILLSSQLIDPAGWSDEDGDGVPFGFDNCVELANPDQVDVDGDGFGNPCDPDYTNDGNVDVLDFGVFLAHFDQISPAHDLDGDGKLTVLDFGFFLRRFGDDPGPSGLACAGTTSCVRNTHLEPNAIANAAFAAGFDDVDDAAGVGQRATDWWHTSASASPLALEAFEIDGRMRQLVRVSEVAASPRDGVGQDLSGLAIGVEYRLRARINVAAGSVRFGIGPVGAASIAWVDSETNDRWETLELSFTPETSQASVTLLGMTPGTAFEIDAVYAAPVDPTLVFEGEGTIETRWVGEGLLVEMVAGEAVRVAGQLLAPTTIGLLPGDAILLGYGRPTGRIETVVPGSPILLGGGFTTSQPPIYLASTLYAYAKFAGKGAATNGAPTTWKPMTGSNTGQYEIDQIHSWTQNRSTLYTGILRLNYSCGSSELTAAQIKTICAACDDKPTDQEKIFCIGDQLRTAWLDQDDNVCRHWAWAMKELLDKKGFTTTLHAGRDGLVGHAWVETTCDGKKCIVDAFTNAFVIIDEQ